MRKEDESKQEEHQRMMDQRGSESEEEREEFSLEGNIIAMKGEGENYGMGIM